MKLSKFHFCLWYRLLICQRFPTICGYQGTGDSLRESPGASNPSSRVSNQIFLRLSRRAWKCNWFTKREQKRPTVRKRHHGGPKGLGLIQRWQRCYCLWRETPLANLREINLGPCLFDSDSLFPLNITPPPPPSSCIPRTPTPAAIYGRSDRVLELSSCKQNKFLLPDWQNCWYGKTNSRAGSPHRIGGRKAKGRSRSQR